MARLVLLRLDTGAAATEQAVSLFRRHDEEQLDAQFAVHNDEAQLIQTAQETAAQLRELFETDIVHSHPAAALRASEKAGMHRNG